MEWLEGTTALSDLLESNTPDSGLSPGLASALGELLADLEQAEVELPDLHAGNVLVDATDKPWLVDFHAARPLGRTTHARTLRKLSVLTAGVREQTSPALRARAFIAWRARRQELRGRASEINLQLVEAIESRARRHRRARVVAQIGRWLRESSRAYLLDRRVVAARELPAADSNRLLEELRNGNTPRLPGDESALVLEARSNRALTSNWSVAARLTEHHLPSARPLLLDRGGSIPRALFALPEGSAPMAPEGSWSAESCSSLGALLGKLHDRGLSCEGLRHEQLWRTPRGQLFLSPQVELTAFEPISTSPGATQRFAALPVLPRAGALLQDMRGSYLEAFRGTASERRALAWEFGLRPH